MTSSSPINNASELARLQTLFSSQQTAFRQAMLPNAQYRQQALQRLRTALLDNTNLLVDAVNADFGNRSHYETKLLEIFPSIEGIDYASRHVKRWMRDESRHVSLWFKPARARVMYQPLGIVGVIVPWNYPIYLALGPLVAALAAGNRVLIKMSEFTPQTGIAMQTLLKQAFSEGEVAVINGEVEVAQAFANLPFDHLLFTGSTVVGRMVMRAASAHLTPVTLELGGKSPAIIGTAADWDITVERILMGKLLNAGQTCVAPDYVLLPAGQEQRFVEMAKQTVAKHYPTFLNNPNYTNIVNARQYQRLQAWLQDAVDKGATLVQLGDAVSNGCQLAPTLILNTTTDMTVVQEEIFGPLLPILSYHTLQEAVNYVNDRPRPLALYYFDTNPQNIRHILENTISGGVSINDTVLHVAQDDLPFGGVGASGMGQYHGREGFETFSKKKPVLYQGKLSSFSLLYPPFGKLADFMLKLMFRR